MYKMYFDNLKYVDVAHESLVWQTDGRTDGQTDRTAFSNAQSNNVYVRVDAR